MKRTALLMLTLAIPFALLAHQGGEKKSHQSIEWLTLEQAIEKAKQDPKPIIVDLYTDWCGYCKRLDAYTFSHKKIAEYISKNFYAVKFNAESKENIRFQGRDYPPNQEGARGAHSLAVAMTQGKLSYPTLIYLDAKSNIITVVPGYYTPSQIEPILHFIGSGSYSTVSWEQFQKNFKSQL